MSAVVIEFIFKSSKIYYPETFLEEYQYKLKEKEIKSLITDDLQSFSDDDSEEEERGDFEEYSG